MNRDKGERLCALHDDVPHTRGYVLQHPPSRCVDVDPSGHPSIAPSNERRPKNPRSKSALRPALFLRREQDAASRGPLRMKAYSQARPSHSTSARDESTRLRHKRMADEMPKDISRCLEEILC